MLLPARPKAKTLACSFRNHRHRAYKQTRTPGHRCCVQPPRGIVVAMAPPVSSTAQATSWSQSSHSAQQQPHEQPRNAEPRQPAAPLAPSASCAAGARRKRLSDSGALDAWMDPYTGSFYGVIAEGESACLVHAPAAAPCCDLSQRAAQRAGPPTGRRRREWALRPAKQRPVQGTAPHRTPPPPPASHLFARHSRAVLRGPWPFQKAWDPMPARRGPSLVDRPNWSDVVGSQAATCRVPRPYTEPDDITRPFRL